MNTKLKINFYYTIAALMIVFSIGIASSKSLRTFIISNVFNQNKRQVLSVLDYKVNNNTYKIVKVQKLQDIIVEIYDINMNPLNIFGLGKYSNGAIFLNGRTTELASYDLDKDGTDEIVVPTIGKNSKSIVFIVKYRASNDTFSLVSPVSYLDQLGK